MDRLAGIDARNAEFLGRVLRETAITAQLPADLGQQRVAVGPGEVIHMQCGRVGLAACCARNHDGDAAAATPDNKGNLGVDIVGTVKHKVRGVGHQASNVVACQEVVNQRSSNAWIDATGAVSKDTDLAAAERVGEGRELTIDVAGDQHVHVDQGQMPDAGSRQGLNGPGANTASAGDQDVCLLVKGKGFVAVESADASEAALVIVFGNVSIHVGIIAFPRGSHEPLGNRYYRGIILAENTVHDPGKC